MINVDVGVKIWRASCMWGAACLASIIDFSMTICGEVIEETKQFHQILMKKRQPEE